MKSIMNQRRNSKTILKLLRAPVFFLLLAPVTMLARSPGQIFADVPTGTALYDATSTLYRLNVTNGCPATPFDFCPSYDLARDDMAALLVRSWSISMSNDPEATNIQCPTSSGSSSFAINSRENGHA